MDSGKKPELDEVRKFLDSILTETFLLTQISISQKIITKTNAFKIRKRLEDNLKGMASKASSKSKEVTRRNDSGT